MTSATLNCAPAKPKANYPITLRWLGLTLLAVLAILIGCDDPLPNDQLQIRLEGCDDPPDNTENNIHSAFFVIIDSSDSLAALQIRTAQEAKDELDSLPVGTWVGVYEVVKKVSGSLETAFCKPRPKSRTDVSSRNQIPKAVERKYQQTFKEPFQAALDSLLSGGESDQSPILESITAFGVEVAKLQCTPEKSCRLWIISDMLQNSRTLSFYDDLQGLDSPIRNEWVPDLRGWQVEVRRAARCAEKGGTIQDTPEFKEFWERYFKEAQVEKLIWNPLSGVAC